MFLQQISRRDFWHVSSILSYRLYFTYFLFKFLNEVFVVRCRGHIEFQILLNTIWSYVIKRFIPINFMQVLRLFLHVWWPYTFVTSHTLISFLQVFWLSISGQVKIWCLTHSHTMTPFDAPGKKAFWKQCGKRRNCL